MHYAIESIQKWATVFSDADYWQPLIEHIVRQHGLPQLQQIRAGHPGSNAVFWVNETFVVKIFGPWWEGDADKELATYQHLGYSGRALFSFLLRHSRNANTAELVTATPATAKGKATFTRSR